MDRFVGMSMVSCFFFLGIINVNIACTSIRTAVL